MGRSAERLRVAFITLRRQPIVERMLTAYPRLTRFVEARFNGDELLGLRLTIRVAIAGVFLFLFLAVAQDLIATDPLVQSDLRVMSLLQVFRSPKFAM